MQTGHRHLLFILTVVCTVIPWTLYEISTPLQAKKMPATPQLENNTPLLLPPYANAGGLKAVLAASIATQQGLQVTCDSCFTPITTPGALLFSPPKGDYTKKHHICIKCYDEKFKPLIRPPTK